MAWIRSFEVKVGNGKVQPTQVVAHVKVIDQKESSPILQIDTFGSDERANPGKQSQTLQMGRDAAQQLYAILQRTYKF
jgi:hypothetical protein